MSGAVRWVRGLLAGVSRWAWRLLTAAVTVAGGGLAVWVHAYPAFAANWWGLADAFLFGAALGFCLCWALSVVVPDTARKVSAARRQVDDAVAETREIRGVDHLVSTVRRERGRVYSAEYVHDRAGKRDGSRRAS